MLWTQNLLVNVRDPVSRIFMKTNKISLLRNITLEDFIALSKWLQKSGKCNISYLLEQQVFHNLEQLSLSNISKNNFYTAKVYYGVKVCRRNTIVEHRSSVSVPCVPGVASAGELNTDYWHRMLGLSWSEDPGLCSRPRPAHLQPKPLVQSLSLDLSTLNVNSILKFIKHFHQESFKW